MEKDGLVCCKKTLVFPKRYSKIVLGIWVWMSILPILFLRNFSVSRGDGKWVSENSLLIFATQL